MNTWQLQWLNGNSVRSYPIVDWGTKRDITDSVQLPDSFLVALYFPVHAALAVEPDKFYVQSLGVYATGYTVTLGYDGGDSDSRPAVAVVNIAKDLHTENLSYAVSGRAEYADSVGQVVIGKLDEIEQLPPGFYSFLPEATTLEADCIRPLIRGISSIIVVNGSARSERLYGDIELIAGTNFRISVQSGGDGEQIVFSAISGEGLNETCVCEDAEAVSPPIRFINGIPPLADGNYRMVGDGCLDISPITNGISLTDRCSSPCCGWTELDALVRQLDRFADGATTLQNFVNNLGGQVTQMGLVVLGSRLGDAGCVTV